MTALHRAAPKLTLWRMLHTARAWIGAAFLQVFNDVFGDPSFGNEKMLVVDYTTASGSKQTAFWRESEARPRVWVNAESGSGMEGAKAEERAAEEKGESAEESLSFNEMLALYSTSTLEREDKAPDQGRPSTKMDDEATSEGRVPGWLGAEGGGQDEDAGKDKVHGVAEEAGDADTPAQGGNTWLEQLLQLQGGGQEQDDVSRKGLEDEGTGDRLWVETSSDWRDEKLVSEDDDMFETADLFSDVLNSSAEVRRQIYVYP